MLRVSRDLEECRGRASQVYGEFFLGDEGRVLLRIRAIAETFDVDYKKVRELWLHDPRMGRSHTMVLPKQNGFNGKCLPKDISAIVEAVDGERFRSGAIARCPGYQYCANGSMKV
jgi:hypothetical protein